MTKTEIYNQLCAERWLETGGMDTLERYVISETLDPIGDYPNAIQLIRQHGSTQCSTRLLAIGAHLISVWTPESNDLLDYLMDRFASLTPEELAIAWFLKAQYLRFREPDFRTLPAYKACLTRSIAAYSGHFVNNRLYYAELLPVPDAEKMHQEALRNIVSVSSPSEIAAMTLEQLTDPDLYIKEHILGTHISYAVYGVITQRNWRTLT
jgi:hypothetical protein